MTTKAQQENGGWERRIVRTLDTAEVARAATKLRPRDLILTYHAIESEPSGYKYGVDAGLFAQQLDYLLAAADVVSLEALLTTPSQGRTRVALTFDDAYADFYDNAYPQLRRRSLPATVFVPTAFIDSGDSLLRRDEGIDKPHLTWDQMREIRQSAEITFESHTHAHHSAVTHSDAFEADLRRSIAEFETHLGTKPRYLAYPYGQHSPATHEIALICGFDTLLTMDDVPPGEGPVQGRLDVYQRNQTLPYFKLTVAGMLGPAVRDRVRRVLYRR